ncbi:MAG TPA: class I SAM-dependent methyltransferase [Candidatus Margulisiibacteriota bacterium]|nr:class I SAM-dependent methyltransferase [Candidatus Margulisiibacteriota bacterium]
MSDDRNRWEERYAAGSTSSDGPSDFLVAHAALLHGRVLDVAGGSGRNALFLARRGLRVDVLDIALAGLRLAQRAARAERLDVRLVQADLESFPLPRALYDAAINIRYLQRSLFEPLQAAVKVGGILLFETFLIDQQTLGHCRNPAYLLQRGELRAAFSRCDILVYEEGLFQSASQSAYLARLVARRSQR